MASNEAETTTRKIAINDQADYYLGITSITVNGNNAYDLKGKFLDDLHKNAFSGTHGEDAVEHIEYFLKIETPQCEKFKEFNYLLKIYPDLLTKDIKGFKTYEEFKGDWIYEWNKYVPWVDEKPWTDTGVWKEPKPVKHTCKPFNYKTGCSEWPTCSWRNDGFCNGGNLPRAYVIRNTLHYLDYEWYEALEDSELKEDALRNKAIMEGLIDDDNDDESRYERSKRWNVHDDTNHDHEHEEYVAVKEDEYEDLARTNINACQAYQEIFRMMDEGWMVTRAE
ncbi:hypothetical protein Tco_1466936 [Tanacetum coccineum]